MLVDIQPFLTYVRSEYLWSHKEGQGYFSDCTVFAISSIEGEHLQFSIMVDGKTVFPNIPISALTNDRAVAMVGDDQCSYARSPGEHISVISHEHLADIGVCGVWNRDGSFWETGTYMLTVQWSNGQQVHLIELEGGHYIFWGDKHITWGDDTPDLLPEYGK
jgi:hypothetical protein